MIIATVVKNEAHKDLRSALEAWTNWGTIVAVDNGSTDGSYEMLQEYSETVVQIPTPLWGQESVVRSGLYRLAMSSAKEGEWVLWMDADEPLSADPNELDGPEIDGIGCDATTCGATASLDMTASGPPIRPSGVG